MAKILITTGIYPPQVGGPAQYALEAKNELTRRGNEVKVLTYGLERSLPPIIRHGLFFVRTLLALRGIDFVLTLDTFSVGWPSVAAARIFNKKIIVRTGGDFLWESYVERTGDLIPLKNFYDLGMDSFSFKEKMIFKITKWTLKNMNAVIFSTEWQKQIFEKAYKLDSTKDFIVENFYGEKLPAINPQQKNFITGGRPVKLKNNAVLLEAFQKVAVEGSDARLDVEALPYEQFIEKLKASYAVILVSISDISPNLILEAIRYNKPFIVTKETGLYEKLKDIGIFVDHTSVEDIKEKILFLSNKENYEMQKRKIESFTFTHSMSEIVQEILDVVAKIS